MARYDITAQDSAAPRRPIWPLLIASLGTLVAAPLYVLLLDVPFIRSTAWPMFLAAGVGAIAGLLYTRYDDRGWVRITGTTNVVGLVGAAVWFFWLAALPTPDAKAAALASAPDFRLPDQNGQPVSLSGLYQGGPVLLVFYRGSWCPFCVSELRGLSEINDDVRRAGVRIVAVSVDSPQHSRQAVDRLGLTFPLLSDTEHKTIQDFGLVHHAGGPGGEDIAIPAQFLIDRDGRILWRRIAGRIQDRPDPRDVLRTLQALTAHASA